jgi:hypothetical protein
MMSRKYIRRPKPQKQDSLRQKSAPNPRAWWTVLAIVVALCGLWFLLNRPTNAPTSVDSSSDSRREPEKDAYEHLIEGYVKSAPPSTWWMNKALSAGDLETQRTLLDKLFMTKKHDIERAIRTCRAVNPTTEQIFRTFSGNIAAGVTYGENAVAPSVLRRKAKVLVLYFPFEERGYHHGVLQFEPPKPPSEQGTVTIAALKMPENMFIASLIHELGHALQGNRDASDDAFVDEELAMHQLEDDVLDYLSKRQYKKVQGNILERRTAASWREFLRSVQVDDLHALDQAIGVKGLSYDVADTQMSHYITQLASRFIERQGGSESDIQTEKRAMYRALSGYGY